MAGRDGACKIWSGSLRLLSARTRWKVSAVHMGLRNSSLIEVAARMRRIVIAPRGFLERPGVGAGQQAGRDGRSRCQVRGQAYRSMLMAWVT